MPVAFQFGDAGNLWPLALVLDYIIVLVLIFPAWAIGTFLRRDTLRPFLRQLRLSTVLLLMAAFSLVLSFFVEQLEVLTLDFQSSRGLHVFLADSFFMIRYAIFSIATLAGVAFLFRLLIVERFRMSTNRIVEVALAIFLTAILAATVFG